MSYRVYVLSIRGSGPKIKLKLVMVHQTSFVLLLITLKFLTKCNTYKQLTIEAHSLVLQNSCCEVFNTEFKPCLLRKRRLLGCDYYVQIFSKTSGNFKIQYSDEKPRQVQWLLFCDLCCQRYSLTTINFDVTF